MTNTANKFNVTFLSLLVTSFSDADHFFFPPLQTSEGAFGVLFSLLFTLGTCLHPNAY